MGGDLPPVLLATERLFCYNDEEPTEEKRCPDAGIQTEK
jgi:hypothetical protein